VLQASDPAHFLAAAVTVAGGAAPSFTITPLPRDLLP
jgi:hypothetical protein